MKLIVALALYTSVFAGGYAARYLCGVMGLYLWIAFVLFIWCTTYVMTKAIEEARGNDRDETDSSNTRGH